MICANGLIGYDTESAKAYHVRTPCANKAATGHIHCDECRVAAGGTPKRKIESNSKLRSSTRSY